MATKVVGVRDLKNHAPKLVQRAERGEKFVVTRHGKAVALLGPPLPTAIAGAGSRRLEEWNAERRAFERSKSKPARKFIGKFVAFRRGTVVDSDRDARALFERVARVLGGKTFFIGRIGDAEPMVDMPGFELE